MAAGDVMRSWRLPGGGVLVEVENSWEPGYHHLLDDRVAGSYVRTLADDCELMYIFGFRVVGDRFEHVTHVEVGHPYRRDVVEVGDTVFEGLIEQPPGSVTQEDLVRATVATDLDAAAGRLRAAFAGYPVRPVLEGCPHCRGTVVVADEDLFDLSLRLGNTVGTYEDMKSHLPAMLADLATSDDLDESIVLGRLTGPPGWQTWPAAERAAITEFLYAMWRALLSAYPALRDAHTFLREMDRIGLDLGPFLRTWETTLAAAADRHLADLVDARTSRTGFPAAVIEWLGRPATRDRLYRAFASDPDGPAAEEFARAYDLLG